MKVEFYCNNCIESFRIDSKYLSEKSSINCPNCSFEFPNESFDQLKQGVALIVDSRSRMKPESTARGYTPKFHFKVIDD